MRRPLELHRNLFLSGALALLVACSGSSPTDPNGGSGGGRVSGAVFTDSNGNGTRDSGEAGASGVSVQIFRDTACSGAVAGSPLATATTDGTGRYTFTGLATGDTGSCYVVRVTLPAQHAATSLNPRPVQISNSAPVRDNLDFGIHPRGLFFVPAGTPGAGNLFLTLGQGPPSATTWSAELHASQVQDLYGVAFDLLFPAELLGFTGATEGTLLSTGANTTMQVSEVAPGHLVVGLTRLGNVSGANGSGLLVTFELSVLGDGHGEMSFTATHAFDGAGQPMDAQWRGGSVLVLR